MIECGDHLARGGDAGDHRHLELGAPAHDRGAEAGHHHEPGTRLDRGVDLVGPDDRSRSDEEIGLGSDQPDGVDRGGSAEGHLGDRQPTRCERLRQRKRGLRRLQDDNGNEPPCEDELERRPGHRASQPPSTGMIAPHT